MAEQGSPYLYGGQWMDELGSLAALSSQVPRVAYDLASIPMSRTAVNAVASSVFGSQLPPYNSGE